MLQASTATSRRISQPASRRLFFRPRSITGLLLTGFGLVSLPLIVAIAFGVIYVDRLTNQSERLVLQGVEVTRHSKRLGTLLTAMERSARQYSILESNAMVDRFRRQTQEFDEAIDSLAALELDTLPDWNLDALRSQSQELSQQLAQRPRNIQSTLEALAAMQREIDLITAQGNLFVDRELERLQATAADARLFLLLCVFALIPGVLVLTAFFFAVLSRPLRQISTAVTRLGDGDFSKQISVFAPTAELDALGTRLDWMRRRLATLENEKQQFIRQMSHELKTPLASIREGAELLRDGTVGRLTKAQAEVADILHQNSIELAKLIENLLDFAAWQQHHAKLEYERFNLRALVEAIVTRQRLTIEGKKLKVVVPDPSIELTADRDRMQLIIDNLLANAVKFSPPSGDIGVSAKRLAEATEIRVTDQGPGVPENERSRIFDAFYQGCREPSYDTALRGTGIGLSVVRECVEAHGGAINVDAASHGGARFRIRIPDRHAV